MTTKYTAVIVRGTEHATAHLAVQWLAFAGDYAISIGRRYFTVEAGELARIQAMGVQPTTWHDVRGRLVSVPGRD